MSNTPVPSIGSTLTPNNIQTPTLDSSAISTKKFTLSGTEVTGISHDPSEINEKKLATIFSVNKAAAELQQALLSLGGDVSELYLSPVLSPPLASPTFSNLKLWNIGDFIVDDSKAIYISRVPASPNQATLRLMTEAFQKPGDHYIDMVVDVLPGGATLTIINEKSDVIKVIDTSGRYRFEFVVDNPGIAYLDFIINSLPQSYSAVISYISIHCVKTEFASYMTYMAGKLLSGGSGFASIEDINRAIATLDKTLREYVNVTLNGNLEAMNAHLVDTKNNPHAITCELIRAAKDVHTHLVNDIAGLQEILDPVAVCVESLTQMTKTIQDHFNADNPHGITCTSIFAAAEVHSHEIGQINGLDLFLAEMKVAIETDYTQKFEIVNQQIARLSTDGATALEMIRKHELATGNVHSAIPEDFGIIHATPAEGIDGTSDTLYMNPLASKAQLESWATLPNVDITRLCPRYCGKIILNPSTLSVKLPVTLGVNYQLVFSGLEQYDIRNLQLVMNGTLESKATSPTITTTLQQDTGEITKQLNCPGLKFLPTGVKYTTVGGTYQFDTTNGVLIGRAAGYSMSVEKTLIPPPVDPDAPVIPEDPDNPTIPPEPEYSYQLLMASTTMDLINVISAYTAPVQFTDLDYIVVSIDAMVPTSEIIIDVYELISAPDTPIAIDANKAGTIIERFGNLVVQDYSLFDGSELNRTIFADLWKYANETGIVIPNSEWLTEVSTNGYCESFSTGNGTSTFRLPKREISNTKTNKYIKLKNTFLASPTQLITQYLW